MYVNIGGDWTVRSKNIVAVFDLDNTTASKITRDFLNEAEKQGNLITISEEELPKSYILMKDSLIYLSPVTPATLLKRMEQ